MFFVLSKDKIISYIVSFGTVMVLLGIAFAVRNKNELIEVASTSKSIPIYSVQTDENKVALTINCAWSQQPMGQKVKELIFLVLKEQLLITVLFFGRKLRLNCGLCLLYNTTTTYGKKLEIITLLRTGNNIDIAMLIIRGLAIITTVAMAFLLIKIN